MLIKSGNVIRIFAIFKSSIFITALEPFLRSNGIEIVSSCNNSSLALGHYKTIDTDVVMMDLNWSDSSYSISGDSLIDQLRQQNPGVRIIGVTSFFNAQIVTRLKAQAVQGYFYRCMDNLVEGVKECIERVYEGEGFYAKKGVGGPFRSWSAPPVKVNIPPNSLNPGIRIPLDV